MALIKDQPTEYGVDASYWNIGAVKEDFKGKGLQVTLYGYANAIACRDGKQPLSVAQVNIVGSEYRPDLNRAELYTIIKKIPEWQEAVDAQDEDAKKKK